MNRALEQYRGLDNSFSQQREHQLLVDLTQAVEQNDGEAFSEKLFQYDQMSKLDNWKTTLLLRLVLLRHLGYDNGGHKILTQSTIGSRTKSVRWKTTFHEHTLFLADVVTTLYEMEACILHGWRFDVSLNLLPRMFGNLGSIELQ